MDGLFWKIQHSKHICSKLINRLNAIPIKIQARIFVDIYNMWGKNWKISSGSRTRQRVLGFDTEGTVYERKKLDCIKIKNFCFVKGLFRGQWSTSLHIREMQTETKMTQYFSLISMAKFIILTVNIARNGNFHNLLVGI